MTLVVFLRASNVGGHRKFLPAALAKEMAAFGVVNIGAAGTFVVKKPVSAAAFRKELGRRLPFETEIMICPGTEILDLCKSEPFAGRSAGKDVRKLVTILAKKPNAPPKVPIRRPEEKNWQVDFFRISGRFAFSFWRRGDPARPMIYPNAIVEKVLGVPGTTRSWSAFEKIRGIFESRILT